MERLERLLGSAWTRILVLAVAIAVAPLLFVWLSPLYSGFVRDRMRDDVAAAVRRAQRAIEESGDRPERVSETLEQIARNSEVWLRVYDGEGRERFGARYALGDEEYKKWLEEMAGEVPEPSHLEAWDRSRPPIDERREFREAVESGRSARCELSQQGRLLTCLHVAKVPTERDEGPLFVYVQDGSIRGVRELAGARYPVLKLVLQVVGVSLLVALLVGWWTVRPIQRLHEQVLDRAAPPVSTDRVAVGATGEIGDLEEAFNDLLGALEERRQANKAYMADIAHEVKNPVAAIRSAAERLEAGDLSEERVDRISRVLSDSSDRLDRLVTRFLELARAEAGLPDERREPLDLGELVERLVEIYRKDERFDDLTITLDVDSVSVEASPTHLETAVRNLVENAASFAESTVGVGVEVDGERAVVSVRDDGPGIDPEDLPHVFDRFFSRRSGDEGTGLGLAMTRAVVEAHDGAIDVASTVGEGTTFTVRLPVHGDGDAGA